MIKDQKNKKESELSAAFSISNSSVEKNSKPRSPIAPDNELPFRFARGRELNDEAETKRFKQKVYMDQLHSSRLQQPIPNERVSLRSLERVNKAVDNGDDEPAFGSSSLINSIGGNLDDKKSKVAKQQAYAKQIAESASLPPINNERITFSHSEAKKRRELMEIASNDGSANLSQLARHVANDFYNTENHSSDKALGKKENDLGNFLAIGLSNTGPNTAATNKRMQQTNYAKALEMDAIAKKNNPTHDQRVSLKDPPVRRNPSNTTLRLDGHDITTTDRLETERQKRDEYSSLLEQDKYRNPIPNSRTPIIRSNSPSGMTGFPIGSGEEAKKIADKAKMKLYNQQLANDAKLKALEIERVPLSPRLRKQIAIKLYEGQDDNSKNNFSNVSQLDVPYQRNQQFVDSMDQQLQQRERIRNEFQPDLSIQMKESENNRMRDLLTQYEVPQRPSYSNPNPNYHQSRHISGGGEQQWNINPQESASRQAAMRLNRLGNAQDYSTALQNQILQLSARKDPYDYVPKESPRDHYSSILMGLPTNWAHSAVQPSENSKTYSHNAAPTKHFMKENMSFPNPAELDQMGFEALKERSKYINTNNPNENLYFGYQQQPLMIPRDYS